MQKARAMRLYLLIEEMTSRSVNTIRFCIWKNRKEQNLVFCKNKIKMHNQLKGSLRIFGHVPSISEAEVLFVFGENNMCGLSTELSVLRTMVLFCSPQMSSFFWLKHELKAQWKLLSPHESKAAHGDIFYLICHFCCFWLLWFTFLSFLVLSKSGN